MDFTSFAVLNMSATRLQFVVSKAVFKNAKNQAVEKAQQERELAAKPHDLSSTPRTHMGEGEY